MDDTIDPAMDGQVARRERVGSHAWVRTAGLIGGDDSSSAEPTAWAAASERLVSRAARR